MTKHPLNVDDLWKIPRVGEPVPAPDASFAIVPVTTYSMETNEKITRLWYVPADGSEPRALTSSELSSEQPALSPDATRLAFVRKSAPPKGTAKKAKGAASEAPSSAPGAAPSTAPGTAPGAAPGTELPQLYVMAISGGEPERLTDLPLGATDPIWFDDGSRIAVITTVFASDPRLEATADIVKARDEDPVKAAVTEDRVYRFWDRWLTEGKVTHVIAVDPATKQTTDLTPGSTRWFPLDDPCNSYRLSPDDREIAFTAISSAPPHDPLLYSVFTAPIEGAVAAGAAGKDAAAPGAGTPGAVSMPAAATDAARLIDPDHGGHAFGAEYSPDGKYIVYGIQREIDFYADRQRLVAFERATGRRTVLTESWDRSASGWSFTPDSRSVVLWAEDEGRNSLYVLDLDGALHDPDAHPPRKLARGGTFTDPIATSALIFTTRQGLDAPPEVFTMKPDGSDLRRFTRFTEAAMSEIELGRTEEILFEGAEGHQVQMYVVHPVGEDTGPMPLVQIVHGGPHAASSDQWHWRWNAHAFAAPGYRAALVNFHGSTGWGQQFAASILGQWGEQPYKDVMAATDLLIKRGLADPKRMAVAGGSYGGYLVAWIGSQTDRFACIVNHAGVSDLQTQYASDVTQGRRRAMGGSPWENIEALDKYNPVRFAKGFVTPMLVAHGERDYRVPYNQGLEIYNILKARHVPARLVCYPDENHWILKPRNNKHWYGEVLGWLAKYIGPKVATNR